MDYIPGGYILLARKIKKSPLWLSLKANHRIVLIELLLQAQFQDVEVALNGDVLFLKRGQLATSYQKLSDDIAENEITPRVVRNAINKLIKLGFLAKDESKARSKKGLLLTIINYDLYQQPENYKGTNYDIEQSLNRHFSVNSKSINKKNNKVNKNEEINYNSTKYRGGNPNGQNQRSYGKTSTESITGGKVGRIIKPDFSGDAIKKEYF
ncbi:hypothetical protein MTP04_30170 [Lysinibacillus sp. PLM2]|nr:hypothetical protein MTP04_30170 [Lysinibacillus sp. PLM2]